MSNAGGKLGYANLQVDKEELEIIRVEHTLLEEIRF